jgi:hypothetical protein
LDHFEWLAHVFMIPYIARQNMVIDTIYTKYTINDRSCCALRELFASLMGIQRAGKNQHGRGVPWINLQKGLVFDAH